MHDAIPSRILNGWLRLEEDLFHLQVLSSLPPQIPICRSALFHVSTKRDRMQEQAQQFTAVAGNCFTAAFLFFGRRLCAQETA